MRRAERWVLINKISWTLLAVLVLLMIWTNRSGVAQPQAQKLRLRELTIVDEKGRDRIVIASPLPDPVVDGKVARRVRFVSAAVQFKAADGTEQGGIALSEDGSMIFGIDDERGHERAHLYYIPKRGSGVFLQGESGKETVSLLVPGDGSDPKLEMTNRTGNTVIALPPRK